MATPTDSEILDAIKQAISDLVQKGYQSVTVAGQTYTYLDLDKLLRLERYYQGRVAAATRVAASESRVSVGLFQKPG